MDFEEEANNLKKISEGLLKCGHIDCLKCDEKDDCLRQVRNSLGIFMKIMSSFLISGMEAQRVILKKIKKDDKETSLYM